MHKLNFSREVFLKKKKEVLAKINSFENFKKKELKIKADLDEASKTLAELSKKFKWWSA